MAECHDCCSLHNFWDRPGIRSTSELQDVLFLDFVGTEGQSVTQPKDVGDFSWYFSVKPIDISSNFEETFCESVNGVEGAEVGSCTYCEEVAQWLVQQTRLLKESVLEHEVESKIVGEHQQ